MYTSLVSVLLMGMWQSPVSATAEASLLSSVTVAPPAREVRVNRRLSASGVLVLDRESGQLLYGKHAEIRRPMASITKLMTALIIAENHDLDEVVTIPVAATAVPGNKAYFEEGDKFLVEDMLSALLISSANDAAVALAMYHSGSVPDFVDEMNARAEQLGLHDTSYANPAGLDDELQYSTPRDIAWLTEYVMRNESLAKRMRKKWDRIFSLSGDEIPLAHTHALLGQTGESGSGSVVAGKTGTTFGARQCLVSIVEHENHEYIMVLLHSDRRYADLSILLETLDIAPEEPVA